MTDERTTSGCTGKGAHAAVPAVAELVFGALYSYWCDLRSGDGMERWAKHAGCDRPTLERRVLERPYDMTLAEAVWLETAARRVQRGDRRYPPLPPELDRIRAHNTMRALNNHHGPPSEEHPDGQEKPQYRIPPPPRRRRDNAGGHRPD